MSSGLLALRWLEVQFTKQLAQELPGIVSFMVVLGFKFGDQRSHAVELLRQADRVSGRLREFRSAGCQLALGFKKLVLEAENACHDRMLGVLAVCQAFLLTECRGNQGTADRASEFFEATLGRFCSD